MGVGDVYGVVDWFFELVGVSVFGSLLLLIFVDDLCLGLGCGCIRRLMIFVGYLEYFGVVGGIGLGENE